MDDAPKFKGFEILETLPRGGMSTVYKARQISLERIVALKTLPPNLARHPGDIDKFIYEARITASLKHPNIVQVYDFGKTEDGVYYFVMEFVSGYNVAHWIRRKQRISQENTLLIAQSVADALKYAWEHDRIIHCDIKPDNIIIDSDGSIKVADLGLARSIHSMADSGETGVVFGTPNYIAPEQSRGDAALDCRTDIYALGATIYHCLTGRMPFAELPPQEIMDRQITDTIPDPQEIHPAIATGSACLIEKMMRKNPADRQPDWDAVIQDIIQVRSEKLPAGDFRQYLPSTARRCQLREQHLRDIYRLLDQQITRRTDGLPEGRYLRGYWLAESQHPRPLPRATPRPAARRTLLEKTAAILLFTAVLVFAGLILRRWPAQGRARGTQPPAAPAPPAEASAPAHDSPAPVMDDQRDQLARELYDTTLQWLTEHPGLFNEAIRKFEQVAADTRGTHYAALALEQAQKLRQGKNRAINRLMQTLRDQAEQLGARHNFEEAAAVFSGYKGEFAAETAKQRRAQAETWQARATAHRKEKQVQQEAASRQWRQVLTAVADAVLTENFESIGERLQAAFGDSNLAEHRLELREMESLCQAAAELDRRLLATFLPQKGLTLDLRLKQGVDKLTIREVTDKSVLAEKISPVGGGYAIQPQEVRLADLTLVELQERLGSSTAPETSLLRGMLAMREKNFDAAARAFENLGEPLGSVLAKAVTHQRNRQREQEAWAEMAQILARVQIKLEDPPGNGQLAALLKQRKFSALEARFINHAAAVFQARYAGTDCARQAEPLWQIGRAAAAAADAGANGSGADPDAGRTPHALLKTSLANHNPGLQEHEIICQLDPQGQPDRLEIVSPKIRTLQPLEQIPRLRELICGGQRPANRSDTIILAPLDDLEPLRNLPLQTLSLAYTRVRNLAPIQGMLSLTRLSLAQTDVADLAPLSNLRLTALDISHTKTGDLAPLQDMPLRELNLNHTGIADIGVLRGKFLADLRAAHTRIRELTPLAGMPLNTLDIRGAAVSDLSPLAGMPLERLDLAGTQVNDLNHLHGMPLKYLDISGTEIKNIAALRGMPLRFLNIQRTAIKDLSPLQYAGIEEIWLDYQPFRNQRDTGRAFTEILRQMPALTTVNGMPWRPNGDRRNRE